MNQLEESARAEAVLAARVLRRRRLVHFCELFIHEYSPGWVHHDICVRLERFSEQVSAGKSPRLMLAMPPRHGKSTHAAQCFPAWHLGRNPRDEMILCSYGDTLAARHSRAARDIVDSKEYRALFPQAVLDKSSKAVDDWRVNAGGGMVAAGVSTGITGKGARVLVIDDPVKDRKEADSPVVREDAWDWYQSTASTRLAPGGGVLVIQTRWHVDDLSGRLLSQDEDGEGEGWELVSYPAIAEIDEEHRRKGEALHPERYDLAALERRRISMPSRDWMALYQQSPSGESGEYFRRADFKWYDRKTADFARLRHVQAWDLAIGENDTADYTVGVDFGIDAAGDLIAVDIMRGRWRADGIVENMIDFQQRWKAEIVGVEAGHIEKAIGPWLQRRIRERGATRMYVEPLKTGGRDKFERSRPAQAAVQQGRMKFPLHDPDWESCVEEMIRFGGGGQRHDDQVDAVSWIGQMADDLPRKWKPRRAKPKKDDSVAKFVRKHMREQRRARGYGAMSA